MARGWVASSASLLLVVAACAGAPADDSGAGPVTVTTSPATESGTDPTPEATEPNSTTSSVAATTTTLPPPHRLMIETDKDEAEISVLDSAGARSTAIGTFDGEVVGEVVVVTSFDGYETETVTLDADTERHKVWLDPTGQILDKINQLSVGNAPKQVAFRPGHDEVWVTLLGGSGLEVWDPLSGELIADVDLPDHGSVEVIFNRDGTLAYVSQMETASVFEIDAESKEVLRRMGTGGTWTKVMVLSPDEGTLWASNWTSNDVSEIDLSTGEVTRKLKTVRTPRGLYVTPDSRKLYVAGFEDGDIQVFDLSTGESRVIYSSGGAMRHLVGSPDGARLYGSDMGRANVVVVDVATDQVTDLAKTDRVPNTIDLSPDGQVLYVSNRGRNNPETYYKPGPEWGTVVVIDTSTGQYLDAVVGGNQTTGLDVSPDGLFLAFSDFLDDRVVIYRIPTMEEYLAGDGGRWDEHLTELVK